VSRPRRPSSPAFSAIALLEDAAGGALLGEFTIDDEDQRDERDRDREHGSPLRLVSGVKLQELIEVGVEVLPRAPPRATARAGRDEAELGGEDLERLANVGGRDRGDGQPHPPHD
jgi:hypothetical protein